MQTRSHTKQMLCTLQSKTQREIPQFEVFIDFNEASSAWKANKKSIGNGQYKYVCKIATKRGECNRETKPGKYCCSMHKKHEANILST